MQKILQKIFPLEQDFANKQVILKLNDNAFVIAYNKLQKWYQFSALCICIQVVKLYSPTCINGANKLHSLRPGSNLSYFVWRSALFMSSNKQNKRTIYKKTPHGYHIWYGPLYWLPIDHTYDMAIYIDYPRSYIWYGPLYWLPQVIHMIRPSILTTPGHTYDTAPLYRLPLGTHNMILLLYIDYPLVTHMIMLLYIDYSRSHIWYCSCILTTPRSHIWYCSCILNTPRSHIWYCSCILTTPRSHIWYCHAMHVIVGCAE